MVISLGPCAHRDSATSAREVAPAISFGGDVTPEQEARFWAKVVVVESCWEWVGATSNGYGQMKADGKAKSAHRLSYEHHVGPIPDGLTLDHLCRNKRCVNPSHLEAVTHHENVLRGESGSAVNARKTHCPAGHPYAGESGKRRCRACKNHYQRLRRAAEKSAT